MNRPFLLLLLPIQLCLFALACSDAPSEVDAGPPTVDVAAADANEGGLPPEVSCENACKRAPRCEGSLVDEAGCQNICQEHTAPSEYACCIQYADDCDTVRGCLTETALTCDPAEGQQPWVPLELFDTCSCGADDSVFSKECKSQGPDNPCPKGAVCLKLVNSDKAPFCAVECTFKAESCDFDETLACETTPKSWYCKKKP